MVNVSPPPIRVPFVDPKTGYLTVAGTLWAETMWQRAGGGGDIVLGTSPSASTDNAIARYDGTGGNVQNSGVTIDDSDNIKVPGDFDATGTISGLSVIRAFQTTVGQASLASGGTVKLLDAATAEQWKVRGIFLSGAGTNFSGGGGDRLLDIKEGTTIFSVIPAATLQTLAAAVWGDTGVPFPATAAHLTTATAAGADIVAAYSGGATDYSAGELTIVLLAEQVT